jgi:hypothetical protein
MRGEHAVVQLHNRCRDLRGRIDGEAELELLVVVDGEDLQEEGADVGATADGTEGEGMEYGGEKIGDGVRRRKNRGWSVVSGRKHVRRRKNRGGKEGIREKEIVSGSGSAWGGGSTCC